MLWDHPRSDDAKLALRQSSGTLPARSRHAFDVLVTEATERVAAAVTERERRLATLGNQRRFGLDWEG